MEWDGLKKHDRELTEEKDAANVALAEAHATELGKAELLSKANDSINDLKLKLEGLEETLSEAKAREETLTKDLEAEKQQRKNEAANHKDVVDGQNRWVGRLVDVAGRMTAQLATMGMPNVRYAPERSGTTKRQADPVLRGCPQGLGAASLQPGGSPGR